MSIARNRLHETTRISFDGYHIHSNRHYCGKRVGQSGYHSPCGNCDGRCGPNSGCQCKACFALDEEIKRRRNIIPEFVNSDGHSVHVSFATSCHQDNSNYRFYCGRRVGHSGYKNCTSGLCDGNCGPSNGCQCIACDALDELLR
jgi:hypothetical protein